MPKEQELLEYLRKIYTEWLNKKGNAMRPETLDEQLALYLIRKEYEIERLNKENQIYKNALDLMCKRYFEDCGCEDCPCGENAEFDEIYCKECNGDEYVKNANGKCWANYYLFIAKRSSKNEN